MNQRGLVLVLSMLLAACGGDDGDGTASNPFGPSGGGKGGSGAQNGSGGAIQIGTGGAAASGSGAGAGAGGAGNDLCGSTLTGTIRDFKASHPDFEYKIEVDPGIVLPDLGGDGKPQYAGQSGNPTTTGKSAFDEWFRDSAQSQKKLHSIQLTNASGNVWTYNNNAFFPIDGQLFGNEGNSHNYHFSFELHTKFIYTGGEVFTFTGDDDLFVYVNGKLGIDLGGVHGAMNASIDLDANASKLGISKGNVYPLDFFFAERHTSESNFRIDTTIGTFVDCGPPPVR
ncbi:MAG TPA: fibro-slime domain-containing protein [Polyangiaceae bacterium]|nr:fibro-slime domain-containing protein [Polyangiaceae bacterium]